MNNSTYRFTLDLQKHQSQMSIAVFQYDTAVRLHISLTDGGKPYLIADGSYAVLYGKRADGKALAHDCQIQGNTEIIYDFEDTTACVAGAVDCQIKLYGTDQKLITAPKFMIAVDERVVSDDDIIAEGGELSAFDEIFFTENERIEAEKEREKAEALRVAAEEARVASETARTVADNSRDAAEQARVDAEQARVDAEAARQSSETKRAANENIRAAKEAQRQGSESSRVDNENERIASESGRELAEAYRNSNEETRTAAENDRRTSEIERVSAESARVTAEMSRKSAWIRYSSYEDGRGFTQKWSEGKNYIGFATARECPTNASDFTWCLFKGGKGDKGDPFSISKMYTSIAEMEADINNSTVPVGSFVMIDTGDVNDDEHGYLYVKNETSFTYISDMSGATGLKGSSAYEIAKENGYTGSESEWLATLVGTGIANIKNDGDRLDIVLTNGDTYGFENLRGDDGKTPYIDESDGYWYIDGENTGVEARGRGILAINKVSSEGNTDTYQISYTDNNKFTYSLKNGNTCEIGTDGYWYLNGVKTSYKAVGTDGKDGKDGTNGTDGKTPVKYVDYFTEADKTDFLNAVMKSMACPLFGVIDESKHITFSGNIPDGTYTFNFEIDGVSTASGGSFEKDTRVWYQVDTSGLDSNCTISNSATRVAEGTKYEATISAKDGYELTSVTVKMGGTNVSVTNGVIDIASVTGNIVITATATEVQTGPTNFAKPTSEWLTNTRLSGSSGNTSPFDGMNVTPYISAKAGDVLSVEGLKLDTMVGDKHSITHIYKSDKTWQNLAMMSIENKSSDDGAKEKISPPTGNIFTYTILEVGSKNRATTETGLIRMCAPLMSGYTIDDVVINIKRDGKWL